MPRIQPKATAARSHEPGQGSRHSCHCGKAYLRPEHLRRHMLTHSHGRHHCHICTRAFSRNDSLQRHITRHGIGRRLRRACDSCRASKRCCDRNDVEQKPCSPCIFKGKACTFSLNIVPSDPELPCAADHAGARSHIAETAFHLLHEVVNSSSNFQRTLKDFEVSAEVMAWFEEQCHVYFEHLHHRWPVIHHTSFDIETDPIVLVVIVILLGCLRGKQSCPGVSEVHSALARSLCHYMLSAKFLVYEAWDFKLFQAILLTTAFALLSTVCSDHLIVDTSDQDKTETQLKQASQLFGLSVNCLRSIDFFSPEAMAYQEQHHFSATFVPYQMLIREKWRRLVVNFFKLDTYIAILSYQAPILNPTELNAELPARFSLWNTERLDIFYRRLPDEPTTRQSRTLKQLIVGNEAYMKIPIFPEDIELALCGMFHQIWTVNNLRSLGNFDVTETVYYQRVNLQLESCRVRLESISAELEEATLTGNWNAEHSLFKAYEGKKDHVFGDPGQIAKARITTLIADAKSLYRMLLGILRSSQDLKILKEAFLQNLRYNT